MDSLLNSLSSTSVSDNQKEDEFDEIKSYKIKGQEERRKVLLLEQKRRKHVSIDSARGIINEFKNDLPNDAMECTNIYTGKKYYRYNKQYRDKLMLSEWFEEIPSDLETDWILVPCPKGHRSLVVAEKGMTLVFDKTGYCKNKFPSSLPGGSKNTSKDLTILDCVFNAVVKQFYVLDVLVWSGQPFVNCDTQCRLFWLKSKFDENTSFSETSKNNKYTFKLLKNFSCDSQTIETILSNNDIFDAETIDDKQVNIHLDGLLFYHRDAAYDAGHTPLVGWLKAYMVPEIFKLNVNELYLQERPPEYTNLQDHIESSKKLKHNWWSSSKKTSSKSDMMETN